MPLENYLIQGEEILAKAGIFVATNKRLIRYNKRFFSEELDDLPYSHITSIGVVKSPRKRLIKAGVIITLIAIITFLSLMVISSVLKSVSGLLKGFMGFDLSGLLAPLIPFSVFMLIGGIVILVLGFFPLQMFIQFRAPGLNKDGEAKFRLSGVRKEVSQNLIRVIREQSLGTVKSEIASVQSPENRGSQTPGQ